jgi:hypothetical protein
VKVSGSNPLSSTIHLQGVTNPSEIALVSMWCPLGARNLGVLIDLFTDSPIHQHPVSVSTQLRQFEVVEGDLQTGVAGVFNTPWTRDGDVWSGGAARPVPLRRDGKW